MAVAGAHGMGGHRRAVAERLFALHLLCPCRRAASLRGGWWGSARGLARTSDCSSRRRAAADAETGTRSIGKAGLDTFGGFGSGALQGRCGGGTCRTCGGSTTSHGSCST